VPEADLGFFTVGTGPSRHRHGGVGVAMAPGGPVWNRPSGCSTPTPPPHTPGVRPATPRVWRHRYRLTRGDGPTRSASTPSTSWLRSWPGGRTPRVTTEGLQSAPQHPGIRRL